MGQYRECGNLIIILRYILAVRLGCTSKNKNKKGSRYIGLTCFFFFFKLILS